MLKKDEEIYFFDESRFGTHSKVGHAWYKKGIRTAVKVKLGYENFYLYSAVNPKAGKDFTLLLPKVNTECMNIFLSQFSKAIQSKKVLLVMDGAAWHKSESLVVPRNIRIIIQPPYSPELNPVERLWLYIKKCTIRNKVFNDVEQLHSVIALFIRSLTASKTKSVCNVNYIYLFMGLGIIPPCGVPSKLF